MVSWCQPNSKKYALKHDRTVVLPRRQRIPVALNASHHRAAVLHGLALGHAGGCVQPKITLPAKEQGTPTREVCNTKVEWLGAALTPPPWQSGASARRNTHASQVVRSTSRMRVWQEQQGHRDGVKEMLDVWWCKQSATLAPNGCDSITTLPQVTQSAP